MNTRSFVTALATLLTVLLVAPTAFFVVPGNARAQYMVYDAANFGVNTPTWLTNILTTVSSAVSAVANPLTAISTGMTWFNQNVLQPIAFIKSGALMKALTAGVIGFVTGTANGTGAPQFVSNIQKSLQTLSDMKTKAYLSQVNLTGSPFASSISAALSKNYMQGSSLGGFWAANQCTLKAGSLGIPASANIPAYLAGNWSQGGVASWFALTTQSQNNPYMLYQKSQAQLANVVGSAVAARTSEISWGSGMMSWCGTSDEATAKANASVTSALQACRAECDNQPGGYTSACSSHCDEAFSQNGGTIAAVGINPGDACTNKDGTQGTIKTPGSVIQATLNKVLGGGQDKLTQMGNIGTQLAGILGSIANIMGTINLAKDILSGPSNGGLMGAGTSATPQPWRDPTAGTAAENTVYQNSASSTVATSGITDRITKYQSSWGTITASTNAAKTSVNSLINTCTTNINIATTQVASVTDLVDKATLQAFIVAATTQKIAAQTALTSEITPILDQAALVPKVIADAQAVIHQVMSGTATSTEAAQNLQTMPPTLEDLSTALRNASIDPTTAANPTGSLIVSGGSFVSQMKLISTNAEALETAVCGYPALSGGGGGGGGGGM